jgi:multiple sugar transport system ATP-binding protein
MAHVSLEKLTKTYPNGVAAVRELSLDVAAGELLILIGPSGCGKTTTLRLIAGLEQPSGGLIRLNGVEITRLPPWRRGMAMVFQRPALLPHRSVRRNLVFGLEPTHLGRLRSILGSPSSKLDPKILAARVTETSRFLGLEDFLDRLPPQLSGGEQQRVALARAIVRQPGAYLLDEPLSHLDGPLRASLRHELHLLQRRLRATMIYVTHDQLEAMTLADRVAVMDRGVLQQVGPPQVVYKQPRNRFVAAFLGWPPMNFLDGRLERVAGALCFRTGDWRLPVSAVQAAAWEWFAGMPVSLGLRPEYIGVAPADPAIAVLAMDVALIESLGHGSVVTFERDGRRLTARLVDAGGLVPRQTVRVGLAMEQAQVFDQATGERLERSRDTG